jgi:cell fate regulator YaaT (PSP1 superfamily)
MGWAGLSHLLILFRSLRQKSLVMAKFVVRFGAMRLLGVLSAKGNEKFKRGDRVIARTNRGLEASEILCPATDAAIEKFKPASGGQIMRRMTSGDETDWSHIHSANKQRFKVCKSFAEKLQLNMQLVDVEQIFGGERVIVYYLAEDRVDFRDLVRELASEFQTRIEMKQIGVRDEAKLLADYGDCGKPVCCNTHLSEMPPVSMKMAKIQRATLDPNKISGRCGRLKCCLRYEYDTYKEMQKELPPIGADVITATGRGRILAQEILAQELLVQTEDHRRVSMHVNEILQVLPRASRKKSPEKAKEIHSDKQPGASAKKLPDNTTEKNPEPPPEKSS